MVYQETSLVPSLTVAQNLYLSDAKPFNRLRGIYIAGQQFLQSLKFPVDPRPWWSSPSAPVKKADGRNCPGRSSQRADHHIRRADGDVDP